MWLFCWERVVWPLRGSRGCGMGIMQSELTRESLEAAPRPRQCCFLSLFHMGLLDVSMNFSVIHAAG